MIVNAQDLGKTPERCPDSIAEPIRDRVNAVIQENGHLPEGCPHRLAMILDGGVVWAEAPEAVYCAECSMKMRPAFGHDGLCDVCRNPPPDNVFRMSTILIPADLTQGRRGDLTILVGLGSCCYDG